MRIEFHSQARSREIGGSPSHITLRYVSGGKEYFQEFTERSLANLKLKLMRRRQ